MCTEFGRSSPTQSEITGGGGGGGVYAPSVTEAHNILVVIGLIVKVSADINHFPTTWIF